MRRTARDGGTSSRPGTSTRSPSRPERAARQLAARSSSGRYCGIGRPSTCARTPWRTSARESPAISTTPSTLGLASQMRTSTVAWCADGRMSK